MQPNLAGGSQGMPLKSIDFEAEVGRTIEIEKDNKGEVWGSVSTE